MNTEMIGVENVSYQYPDGTQALRAVSFTVEAGERVAFIGANGAGKSTLLSHLGGVVAPQVGVLRIDATLSCKETLTQLRSKVGFVFQNPDDQLFMPTLYDDVAFGPRQAGLAAGIVAQRVEQALQTVGLWECRERPPQRLSGGQKRAAAIATVLALEPAVLVLDEPTAGLDWRARRQLIELLSGLPQTQLVATHDLDMVWDICQRTIILQQGRVLANAATTTLLQDEALLLQAHLELPLRLQGCPQCKKTK